MLHLRINSFDVLHRWRGWHGPCDDMPAMAREFRSRQSPGKHHDYDDPEWELEQWRHRRGVPGRAAPSYRRYRKVPGGVAELPRAGATLPAHVLDAGAALLGAELSSVRIHEGPQAEAMGALAYTRGRDIFFQPGLYDPHSARGLELLGHELTHVVQQAHGRVSASPDPVPLAEDASLEAEADLVGAELAASAQRARTQPVLSTGPASRQTLGTGPGAMQRRRIPKVAELKKLIPKAGPNTDANLKGVIELIKRAEAEMGPKTQLRVLLHLLNGFSVTKFFRFLELPQREQCLRLVHSIHAIAPNTLTGNPALRNLGPRPHTNDAANITRLVHNAHKIFRAIASGAHDKSIGQVFGKKNIATAKHKYAKAHHAMHRLHHHNKILTDRSGYNAEVHLGGLTNHSRIMLAARLLDNPDEDISIVTMIHEAMHAGNYGDVSDKGYIKQAMFTQLPEAVKLTNAAHFEVVPRRILKVRPHFAGKTFTPAKPKAQSYIQKGLRLASEDLRKAWTVGLNLHKIWAYIQKNPKTWSTMDLSTWWSKAAKGLHFDQSMPYWSKVQKLTVHQRPNIKPTAGKQVSAPVTAIDMALSEGMTRLIVLAMKAMPKKEKEALAFLDKNANWIELAYAAGGADACRNVLLILVLRKVGPITGPPERDVRAIKAMANANSGGYLVARSPNDFKD